MGVCTGDQIACAGLVAGEERARASEVEALRHRDADEVVPHLHDRRCVRSDREGHCEQEDGEEATRHVDQGERKGREGEGERREDV